MNRCCSMEVTFLGTRGGIEIHSRRHRRHSSLLVEHHDARIMIDCGADWLGRLRSVAPTAIVLTHAHFDHAFGLAEGAPCPVHATKETLDLLHRFPIHEPRRMPVRRSVTIDGVIFKAFPVRHSIRAPAVGYRVSAEESCFFLFARRCRIPDGPWCATWKQSVHWGWGDDTPHDGEEKERDIDRPRSHHSATRLV